MRGVYSHTGRPSIDPSLMIRMLVIGHVMGLRSERRLCHEVHLNLAYRWFCRLGLEEKVPDHSSFSKLRHGKFRESDIFRRIFERVVAQCIARGLIGGKGFAVDASSISADVQKQSYSPEDEWDASTIDPTEARGQCANISIRSIRMPSVRLRPSNPSSWPMLTLPA